MSKSPMSVKIVVIFGNGDSEFFYGFEEDLAVRDLLNFFYKKINMYAWFHGYAFRKEDGEYFPVAELRHINNIYERVAI